MVQNQKRFASAFDNCVGVFASLFQGSLECVNILEADDRPLDFVVPGLVRTDAHQVPSAIFFAHLAFMQNGAFDSPPNCLLQVVQIDVGPDLSQTAADISGNQIEKFLRRRRETSHTYIIANHYYGNIYVAQ